MTLADIRAAGSRWIFSGVYDLKQIKENIVFSFHM